MDTLVAQHLIKTVTAARLMWAECAIAQAIVHLGIDLSGVATKAAIADAFALAMAKAGLCVVARGK